MPRKLKKGSAIYQYLNQLGILEQGSPIEISIAIKSYWAEFRRKWKQAHRQNYKSFTIFFTPREHQLLAKAADASNCSVNQFIKNACMSVLPNTPKIDKKRIGKIRECLILFHSHLQAIAENSSYNIDAIIDDFDILENNILSLLVDTKSISRVD